MTIADLLAAAKPRLRAAPFDISPREATLLLGHLLGWSEAQVRARNDRWVEPSLATRYRAWIDRRIEGEPVAYLLQEREFFGRTFFVDDRVLIPRPETEHIVEVALKLPLPSAPRILDIGCGSGCLALTLAAELPSARVVAVDLSAAALAVTDDNRRRHQLQERVLVAASDLSSGLRLEGFDLVVSNPPYIDPAERTTLSPEVTRYEPHLALFADGDGKALVERLLDDAKPMRSGAFLVMEIGYDQGEWLRRAVAHRDHLQWVEIRNDLAGIPRTGVLRRR